MPAGPRRLLSIAHSYVVTLNRRLPNEIARAGGGRWEVTAVAPRRFRGDLGPLGLETPPGEAARVVGVGVHGTRSPHLFFYGPKLRKILREPWDAVHLWEEPFVLAAGEVARWTPAGVPLVFATYQNLGKSYPPPFSRIERAVVRRSSGWIAGGETVRRALGDRPCYRERPVATIPMGVDVELFRPSPEARARVRGLLGWSSEEPLVFGYLGRFVPEKGISVMRRALETQAAPWRALLVGGGPLEAELRAWAARFPGRVEVVPAVRHDEVPDYLNAMDVLLAPSQTIPSWREQFGRMVVEAFACGVPVIASDSGELPHTAGDAGVVVGEADEAGWGREVARMLESSAHRADWSRRGRERAERTFAWSIVASRTLELIESVAARQGPAPRNG